MGKCVICGRGDIPEGFVCSCAAPGPRVAGLIQVDPNAILPVTNDKLVFQPPEARLDAAVALVSTVEGFLVDSADSYAVAGTYLQQVKGAIKDLEGLLDIATGELAQELERRRSFFRVPLKVLKAVESKFKDRMLSYRREEERRREDERIAAQKAADATAAAQRKALEDLTLKAIDKGQEELAEKLIETHEAAVAPVVQVPNLTPAVKGVSVRKVADLEFVEVLMVPVNLLLVTEAQLAATKSYLLQLRRTNGPAFEVPGVRFFDREVMSSRSSSL